MTRRTSGGRSDRWFWWLLAAAATTTTTTQRRLPAFVAASDFEPYDLNGGLVSAVAGEDFTVVAADTRMFGGGGYLLQSRNHLSTRMWSVGGDSPVEGVEEALALADDRRSRRRDGEEGSGAPPREVLRTATFPAMAGAPVVVGSSGCAADCAALRRVIRADLRAAGHYYGPAVPASPDRVATLLSQVLYLRRGFPYYAFCVVSGMRPGGGCGEAYVYDAIGSFERVAVAAAGTGREALQPILDRVFEPSASDPLCVAGTADGAVDALCEAYRSVSEREIGVGDKLVLCVSERKSRGDGESEREIDCRVIVVPLKEH